jgi:hypothetical protein
MATASTHITSPPRSSRNLRQYIFWNFSLKAARLQIHADFHENFENVFKCIIL